MVGANANRGINMKVKIKIFYEWEEDLTDCWNDLKEEESIEQFQSEQIKFNHAIERLDCAADNHILNDYKRDLQVEWTE